MSGPQTQFLQGTLDLLILRTLLRGPLHGHAIADHIRHASQELKIETGSLYPALHRLEAQGLLAAKWQLSDKGKRAKFYRLTRTGQKHLSAEQSRWDRFVGAVGRVLRPAE